MGVKLGDMLGGTCHYSCLSTTLTLRLRIGAGGFHLGPGHSNPSANAVARMSPPVLAHRAPTHRQTQPPYRQNHARSIDSSVICPGAPVATDMVGQTLGP